MKNKNLGDMVISGAAIALCGFFWAESASYADEVKIFPRLFLAIFAASSLVIFLRAAMAFAGERRTAAAQKAEGTYVEEPYDDEGTDLKPLAKQLLPYAGLLAALGYILCIQFIGFFVSTAVFMMVFMRFLQMKNWPLILAVTAGVEIFIYVVFVWAFAIRLPSGLLF